MKIRIKNNNGNIVNNKLFELDNPIKQENGDQQQSDFDAMSADTQYMYMQEKKKERLPIDIIVSDSLGKNLNIPNVPEDINNIMSSYQTNKARKTENIGGVMVDPIKTYDHAEDICETTFGKYFGDSKKISLSLDKKDHANESLSFNNLNEEITTAGQLGVAVGDAVGQGGAALINFTAGATAMTLAHIAAPLAAIGLGAYGLGYVGQLVAGDTTGTGVENDKTVKALIDERKKMLEPSTKMPMDYGNIIDALDQYINNILESMENIAKAIGAKDFSSEVSDFVSHFLITETKEVDNFIQANSAFFKKQRNELESLRRAQDATELNNKQRALDFLNQLTTAMGKSSVSPAALGEIVKYYSDNVDNRIGIEMADALKTKGYEAVINIYNNRKTITKSALNAGYEVKYNDFSKLNEAEENNTIERKPIDLSGIYKKLLIELKSKIKESFKNIDSKNLSGLEDAKKQMTDMITAADNEIKRKIELITKSPTSQNYGKETGLGEKAIQFLAGHPIEAENLQGVWSRHLADLNNRMSQRIHQMTDFENEERTLGWTRLLCVSVFPDLLARLMTYRYGYALLSNANIYQYDTPQMEQDKKSYENVKDLYIGAERTKLLWLLEKYSGDYTNNGQSIVIKNEADGGYQLNSNYLAYGSFLILNLGNKINNINRNLISAINQVGYALANIEKAYPDSGERLEKFLDIVFNNLSENNQKKLLGTVNGEAKSTEELKNDFDEVAARFKLSDDIIKVKPTIIETFKRITEQYKADADKIINNVSESEDDDIAKRIGLSFQIIFKDPTGIYNAYIKHKSDVDAIISKYKEAFLEGTDEAEISEKLLEEMRNDIYEYFGEDAFEDIEMPKTNIYNETIQKMFSTDGNQDYYAYILSWFGKEGINKIDKINTHSAEGIQKVCTIVSDIINLALSGILSLGVEIDKGDEEKENTQNNLFEQCKTLSLPLYEYYIINNDNAPDEIKAAIKEPFDNIYNNIVAKYKDITKDSNYSLELSEDIFKNFITALHTDQMDKICEYKIIANPAKEIKDPKQQLKDFEGNTEEYNKIIDDMYTTIIETIKTDKNNYDLLRNCIIAAEEILKESQPAK